MHYRFGPFTLVPEQRHLERDGVAIALTPKAFDLLVTLVRHRTRALAKDEILTLVWPGAVVEEGNLAQQVLQLRRALDDDGRYVATLPRHGYRFVAPVVEEAESRQLAARSWHCLRWDDRDLPLAEGLTIVGRAEDADLRLPLPTVSRHHARLVVSGLDCTLEDLGSRHGTWRGVHRLQQPVQLVSGDQLRLGTATLVYVLVTPDETTG